MIFYPERKFHPRFLCSTNGSVMPFSCLVALPCACVAVGLKLYAQNYLEGQDGPNILGLDRGSSQIVGAAFSGMQFLIGFLVVFRAQQAYKRFWEGCSSITAMQGFWFDTASSLLAFCKLSTAPQRDIVIFQHTLVRLLSLLSASVLMELSKCPVGGFEKEDPTESQGTTAVPVSEPSNRAFELELIDAEGLDSQSLLSINSTADKVELLFQWIQQLIVESNAKQLFSVQAPILARCFQELASGMLNYRQALKIAKIPMPFPYVQATELLLVSHWLLSPFLMCIWIVSPLWTGVLTFVQVAFFWSLNSIATELENPFGEDTNDLPAQAFQREFNNQLLLLLRPSTGVTARLSRKAASHETKGDSDPGRVLMMRSKSRAATTLTGVGIKREIFSRRRSNLEGNKMSLGHLQGSILHKMNDPDEQFSSEAEQAPIEEPPASTAVSSRKSSKKTTKSETEGLSAGSELVSGLRSLEEQEVGTVTETELDENGLESQDSHHINIPEDSVFLKEIHFARSELLQSSEHKPKWYLPGIPELVAICQDLRDKVTMMTPVSVHVQQLLEVGKDVQEFLRLFNQDRVPVWPPEAQANREEHILPPWEAVAGIRHPMEGGCINNLGHGLCGAPKSTWSQRTRRA